MNASNSSSKRPAANVVVELSLSRVPPTLPFELKDHVLPDTWASRMSALNRLASQYCQPTFERVYLVVILLLTFLVPITVYHVTLQTLENTEPGYADNTVWLARLISFAITVVTWIILSVPVVVWKYLGRVRVARLAEQWTKTDALAAPSYRAAPVWRASAPGLFRDAVMLMVTVPLIKKSHFDPDVSLPPYIATGDDALPPYRHSKTISWSKGSTGGIRFGELPIYNDDKMALVQV